ncbi:uncharacterized protein WCC33_009581 [Rhinophrynus dorsalis]
MPNLKKSGVWNHFYEITEGSKIIGKCKYCGQTYANNATRMKRHLATLCLNCPEKIRYSFKKLLLQQRSPVFSRNNLHQDPHEPDEIYETTDLPSIKTENVELQDPGEIMFTTSVSQVDIKSGSCCSTSRQSVSSFEDTLSEKGDEKDEVLNQAICMDGEVFSINKKQYQKEHYKSTSTSYTVTSHYRALLDRADSRAQTMDVQKITKAESLTLLLAGWIDTQGNNLLNIRFATPEPIYVKAISTNPPYHTDEYIANVLSEEIERAGPSRVQALVTDNAINMKNAWQILKVKYPHLIMFGCLGHGLTFLANYIVTETTLKVTLENCEEIVKEFNNNHVVNDTLKILQKEEQWKTIALSLSTETKWESAIAYLDSLLCLKNCLQHITVHDSICEGVPAHIHKHILDNNGFWVQVQGAFNLLMSISVSIKKLEEDPINISAIPEIFRKLNDHLHALLPSLYLSDVEEVKQVFNQLSELCCHPVQLAANLLDPRFCGDHLSEDELCTALDTIVEVAKNVPNTDEIIIMTDIAEYRAKEKLWSRDIIWRAAKNMSPLTWWKGFCKTRQLSRIATRILNIPSTVNPCEQN